MEKKNTAYFLAIKKKKIFTHLNRPDNSVATGKDEVSKEILSFCEPLYAECEVLTDMYAPEFLNNGDNLLSEQEQSNCDGLKKEAECLSALKNLKNGNMPVTDSLAAEILQAYIDRE